MYRYFIELVQIFNKLGAWQKRGLALWCCGVILAESCQISRVSDALMGETRSRSSAISKRLSRFLGNKRISNSDLSEQWVKWIASRYVSPHWVILVDETKLSNHVSVMMVGVAYRGRAIPLLWRCYQPNAYPIEGQVEMIANLLAQLKACVPRPIRLTVMADRGIGTSPDLIRHLEALGYDYLLRVQGTSRIQLNHQQSVPLKQLVKPGERWQGRANVFKKAGWLMCEVRIEWRLGEQSPWCLVSNCAARHSQDYGQRAWHEHSFRDLKSFGFNWQLSHVWQPDRLHRLLLILAIAYTWLLSQAQVHTPEQSVSPARTHPRESLFRRGLRWFRQFKARQNNDEVYPDFYFCPDTPLLC